MSEPYLNAEAINDRAKLPLAWDQCHAQ